MVTKYQHNIDSEKRVRILRHTPIAGINGDYTLTNSQEDFINQKISYQVPPDQSSHWLFFTYTTRLSSIYDFIHVYFDFNAIEQQITGNSWEGNLYITNEDPNVNFGKTTKIFASPDSNFLTHNWFESPPVQAFNNKVGFFTGYSDLNYFKPYGRTSTFGTTPIFSYAFHINNWYGDKNISINITANYGLQFYGSLNEFRGIESSEAHYKILNDDETIIDSGKVFDFEPIDVAAGEYSVVVNNNNYYLGELRGLSELKSHFDLNKEDPNPPDMLFLRIIYPDSNIVYSVKIGENALIEFALADIEQEKTIGYSFRNYYKSINIDSIKLFFRV